MTNIEKLKSDYNKFKEENSILKNISQLKKDILSSDSDDILEFHYLISNDLSVKEGLRNMIKSFFYSEVENKRDANKVANFLYQKHLNTSDSKTKGELLRMLGHLRTPLARDLALREIASPSYDLRYNSIIVLGWVGTSEDISILNNDMLTDKEALLRGYCATAMRQLWHRDVNTKSEITKYIYEAMLTENENDALVGMIITMQDLHLKKFGIKESHYGDVSGDVKKAKDKAIQALAKAMEEDEKNGINIVADKV